MRGFRVRKDAYVTVAGTDLIRMPSGEFVVLVHSALYQTYISYPIEAALEA
jgi:uncharacterized circularly permuted ATP-grasp superfamily protein